MAPLVAPDTTPQNCEFLPAPIYRDLDANGVGQIESDEEDEQSESDITPAPRKLVKRRRLDQVLPSTS